MSLINKMLQDLDARGQQSGETMQSNIKSVVRNERRVSVPLAAGLALLALAIGLAGVVGWRYFKPPAPAAAAPAPRVAAVVAAPAPPALVAAPAPVPEAVAAPAAVPTPSPAAVIAEAPAVPAKKSRKEKRAEKAAENKAAAMQSAAAGAATKQAAPAAAGQAASGRQLTAQQRAESEYRRALATLADGRTGEAVAALEQSLQIEPRHDAARQTLVGLLIENRRQDEAIRQLQLGLTLDPRQPSLAMLLARLQIERGGSGIDTLTRTLPYAAGNGEYHAFLAGALQREQRHREAVEQYQQALRGAPQNGVWSMGLGISLQAEKRNAEALEAFQKSKASGTLAPELLAFVERKLQQLSR